MTDRLRLIPNEYGSYDLIIQYDSFSEEFALDFLSKERIGKSYNKFSDFIEKNAKNVKISTVKLMVAGTIVATIPFTSFSLASAAESKYSMSYLYFGTAQQQIEYVTRTNNSLQTVSPSYFDINTDGSLKLNTVSKELVNAMHENGIKVVPFLSNHWDRTAGINALKDVNKLSSQIAEFVSTYNFDGVNVDIENVTEAQRSQYTELVRQLREKLPAGKEVSVAVAANPYGWNTGWHGSYDYAALSQNSDYLMMMTYDEHYEGSTAGPVASIGFVEDTVNYALSKTSSDKIVVGLPFFGRIWSVNDTSVMGKGIPIETINLMIMDYNAVVTFDEASQSPKAEFEVKAGDKQYTVGGKALAPGKYVIWYENEQSLQEKLNLISEYDLKGAGSWALGQEDVSIWNNYTSWLNGATPQTEAPADYIIYTAVTGDSLWKISQAFGTTVDNIKVLNNLSSDMILVGQQLKIPVKEAVTPEIPPAVPGEEIPPEEAVPEIPPDIIVPDIQPEIPTEVPPAEVITETTAWITAGTTELNVRASADLSSAVTGTLDGGAEVTILGNAINGLYHIRLTSGQTGYVFANFITTEKPEVSIAETPNEAQTVTKKTAKKVSVRQSAASTGKNMGNIDKGVTVTVLGVSGDYTLVTYNGITGYVGTSDLI